MSFLENSWAKLFDNVVDANPILDLIEEGNIEALELVLLDLEFTKEETADFFKYSRISLTQEKVAESDDTFTGRQGDEPIALIALETKVSQPPFVVLILYLVHQIFFFFFLSLEKRRSL